MKAVRPGKKLKRQEDQASFVSWRFALLCGCILLALVGLMLRVAYLQVINPESVGERRRHAFATCAVGSHCSRHDQ